jgi:hypothetical protein
MRKLLIWFVLLLHVNTYMFFPMMDEEDVYDNCGKPKDDINTLVEFINQILLGHKDSTPEDEDDDQAHFYQLKHTSSYTMQYMAYPAKAILPEPSGQKPEYAVGISQRLLTAYYDISAPPPEV